MELPILIEAVTEGYRASTQSPISIAAVGFTEDAALAALSVELQNRLQNGTHIRSLRTPDAATLSELSERIANNPIYPAYLDALAEYRNEQNAVPDAD